MSQKVKLFKEAFQHSRPLPEIFNGFGFEHLSNVTSYYVHPDNESYDLHTSLAQPIAEAISLFQLYLQDKIQETNNFNTISIVFNDPEIFIVEFEIPEAYPKTGGNFYKVKKFFCASTKYDYMNVYAYDEDNNIVSDLNGESLDNLDIYNGWLPLFFCLVARDYIQDESFRRAFNEFFIDPTPEQFVFLNENFYQKYKKSEYKIFCSPDLSPPYKLFDLSETDFFKHFKNEYLKNNQPVKIQPVVRKEIQKFDRLQFPEEDLEYIPALPEEIILPEQLTSLCSAITEGDVISTLFYGPAGTGKTMNCKLIAQTINIPLLETVNCTENLDEFVLGKYIPQDDKIVFKESFVTKAIRDGGAVVFEEINFAKPQYIAFLNSLLDDNGFVRLDNGDLVKRHKNFRFFATMNLGYFGTRELNQALYNRFNAIIEISSLSDEAIKRMLLSRVPEGKEFINKILSVYHKILQLIQKEELDIVISPRNLENWMRLAKYEGYKSAAEKTIIPIAKSDPIIEEALKKILKIYRWE